ncbi:MAG: hypothetical protein JXA33_17620 [Anaerolineae bacterium]|nr:hypothetical protein [Anaerolineae bacterium]
MVPTAPPSPTATLSPTSTHTPAPTYTPTSLPSATPTAATIPLPLAEPITAENISELRLLKVIPLERAFGSTEIPKWMKWSPDGVWYGPFLANVTDNELIIWDRYNWEPHRYDHSFLGDDSPRKIYAVSWSPDSKEMYYLTSKGIFGKWSLSENMIEQFQTPMVHFNPTNDWSSDGSKLAVANYKEEGMLLIFDPFTGAILFEGRAHQGGFYELALSPDGTMLATNADNENLIIWDAANGEILISWEWFSDLGARSDKPRVKDMVWSPDSQKLAFEANGPHRIMIWSITNQSIIFDEELKVGRNINQLTWSPDGQLLAAAFDDNAGVWDMGGNEIQTLNSHDSDVWSLDWSPDGGLIATVSSRIIYVWGISDK